MSDIKPRIRTVTMARVSITVEVQVGSWGPECQLSQVYQQAEEGAVGRLRRLLNGEARIVGATKILAITTDTESRND